MNPGATGPRAPVRATAPADPAPAHWARPVRALHWLGVALVLAVAAIGLVMVDLERGSDARRLAYSLHKSLGITALLVALLRLAARGLYARVAPPGAPGWAGRVARLAHALMYLLLLAMPLSGWLLNSVAGQPLPWFGLVELPALSGRRPQWREAVDAAHVWMFWSLMVLVALHVGAVLRHRWRPGDDVLQRMWPGAPGR